MAPVVFPPEDASLYVCTSPAAQLFVLRAQPCNEKDSEIWEQNTF
jgi:hypothetical protein